MRHFIKALIISAVSFYIAYKLILTIKIGADPQNLLFIIGGLFIISQIINPIFSLILLPINLLTFGLVSFIVNIAFIFALLRFLPGFSMSAYDFPGANIEGFIIPPFAFGEIQTILLTALIITVSHKILHIIFE